MCNVKLEVERRVDLVLFDLDGTLIDSAPDLAGATQDMLVERGLPMVSHERLRAMVGSGARGMIGVAFDLRPGEPGFAELREEFLFRYRQRLLQCTQVFPDVVPVLNELDRRQIPWGIVTNKALDMAEPIAKGLGLSGRCQVLIGGDSTPFTKPHPAPLLEAARRSNTAPVRCAYVGDDVRDMRAGRAAGMATLAASWGYLGMAELVDEWGASSVLKAPKDLLNWLELP